MGPNTDLGFVFILAFWKWEKGPFVLFISLLHFVPKLREGHTIMGKISEYVGKTLEERV